MSITKKSNIRLCVAYEDPVATCAGQYCSSGSTSQVSHRQNCSVTSRPTQTGLYMPLCLTTRKNDL